MNKKKDNKVNAIIGGIIIVGIAAGITLLMVTVLFVKSFFVIPKMTDEEILMRQEQRLEVVKSHMEKKYEKKFIINPHGTDGGGSPIPFSRGYYTVTYESYAEDDPEYYFSIDVVPKSIDNNDIEEIYDNYCWKFLREKLKTNVEDSLKEYFVGDYKLILDLSSSIRFENNIKPDSAMEDYFNGSGTKPIIYIYLFTSEKENDLEIKTEQRIFQLLNQIKENSNNVSIEFYYYVMAKQVDFEKIDTNKEDLRLYNYDVSKTYTPVRDMDKEMKFQLMIDTDDK